MDINKKIDLLIDNINKVLIKPLNKADKSKVLSINIDAMSQYVIDNIDDNKLECLINSNNCDDFSIIFNDNTIITETAEEYKSRKAKEKEEKAKASEEKKRLKEIQQRNNEFIKFIKTLTTDEFSPSTSKSIINKVNDTDNIFREFTLTLNDDKSITLNYPKNDFTIIDYTIKSDYVLANIPYTVENMINANLKTVKIDSNNISLLKKCKTTDIINVDINENGITFEIVAIKYNTKFIELINKYSNITIEELSQEDKDKFIEFNENLEDFKKYMLNSIAQKYEYDLNQYLESKSDLMKITFNSSIQFYDYSSSMRLHENELIDNTKLDINPDLDLLEFTINNKNMVIPNKCIFIYLKSETYTLEANIYNNNILELISSDNNVIARQYFRSIV